MGMSSDVRLAAWMPAKRATSSGLPLGFAGSAERTAAESSTNAEAVAVRFVAALGADVDHAGTACGVVVRELRFGWLRHSGFLM